MVTILESDTGGEIFRQLFDSLTRFLNSLPPGCGLKYIRLHFSTKIKSNKEWAEAANDVNLSELFLRTDLHLSLLSVEYMARLQCSRVIVSVFRLSLEAFCVQENVKLNTKFMFMTFLKEKDFFLKLQKKNYGLILYYFYETLLVHIDFALLSSA